MRIEKLTLKNYRCFDDFDISFPTFYIDDDGSNVEINLHVLLAPNMTGKSAILKALRIAIASAMQKIRVNIGNIQSLSIGTQEHRVLGNNPFSDIAREVEILIEGTALGSRYSWKRYKEDYAGKKTKTTNIAGDIAKDINANFNSVSESKTGVIPMFLFIGTEYIHQQKPVTDTLNLRGTTKQGYWYCLDDKSLQAYVFDWFQTLFDTKREQELSPLANEFYDDFAANTLETFREAVKKILPNIQSVDWVRDTFNKKKVNKYFLVFKIENEGTRTYDMLSDGYRYLVLLVGELITRATILNKHLGRGVLREITGTIMIDEFGIHLHPNLQSETLKRLSDLFPKVQFIVTTHSPLLINGLRKEQLHLIEEGPNGHRTASNPAEDAIGLGAEGILREMFGLETTYDDIAIRQNEAYKTLLNKKNLNQISDDELEQFGKLTRKLAPLRIDPMLTIVEEDPITTIVKERLKNELSVENLNIKSSPEDLKQRVNSVIDGLLKG